MRVAQRSRCLGRTVHVAPMQSVWHSLYVLPGLGIVCQRSILMHGFNTRVSWNCAALTVCRSLVKTRVRILLLGLKQYMHQQSDTHGRDIEIERERERQTGVTRVQYKGQVNYSPVGIAIQLQPSSLATLHDKTSSGLCCVRMGGGIVR